jgi:hypothetical protein
LTFVTTISQEAGGGGVGYPALSALNDIDISGGVGLHKGLGMAVHFNGANYSSTVNLAVIVPSPYFFNTSASDAATSATPLERRERALDVSAQYTIPASDRVVVRVFGGPTFFRLTNDMVSDIRYLQAASPLIRVNVVAISGFTHQEVSGTSLGVHAGADLSVFFSRHVGIGGGVRLNHGVVNVIDPLSEKSADLKVGHVEAGGGLRIRL